MENYLPYRLGAKHHWYLSTISRFLVILWKLLLRYLTPIGDILLNATETQ